MRNAVLKLANESNGLCTQLDVSGKIDTPEEARTALDAMDRAFPDPFDSVVLLEGDETVYDYGYLRNLGQFKNLEEYRAQILQPERERKLGPFLASLPPSPEEESPIDTTIAMIPGMAYRLGDVWKGLPEPVRVFLTGVKEMPDLAIAYETADAAIGTPTRWHLFERNGLSPDQAPGTATSGNAAPPTGEPTVNFSIASTVASGAIVIGVSLGLKKIFPDLKPEGRNAVNLASIYVGNYLLSQSKFFANSSWEAFNSQLPGMMSLGMIASLLVDRAGALVGSKDFQFGGLGHELASMGLTLGAFYTLLSSKTLSPLMTGGTQSSEALETLANESGLPWIARAAVSGLSWENPAGGAGVLGGIGQGLKVAGWFGLSNLILGGIKSLANPIGGDPEKRLDDFVEDLLRVGNSTGLFGKYGGAVVDGFLGHLSDGIISFIGLFSDNVKEGRRLKKLEIKNELTEGSEKFGAFVRQNLSLLIAQSIRIDTGEIDWLSVKEGIQKLYAENAEGIENHYKILEYTGHLVHEAQEVKDLIRPDGTFDDSRREALKHIAKVEISYLHDTNERLELNLLRSIGALKEVGNEIYVIPRRLLTTEQNKEIDEKILPLNNQIIFLENALKLLNGEKLIP